MGWNVNSLTMVELGIQWFTEWSITLLAHDTEDNSSSDSKEDNDPEPSPESLEEWLLLTHLFFSIELVVDITTSATCSVNTFAAMSDAWSTIIGSVEVSIFTGWTCCDTGITSWTSLDGTGVTIISNQKVSWITWCTGSGGSNTISAFGTTGLANSNLWSWLLKQSHSVISQSVARLQYSVVSVFTGGTWLVVSVTVNTVAGVTLVTGPVLLDNSLESSSGQETSWGIGLSSSVSSVTNSTTSVVWIVDVQSLAVLWGWSWSLAHSKAENSAHNSDGFEIHFVSVKDFYILLV